MSELEPNVKFQHNDNEPHLAPALENVISAHLHFRNSLQRLDIFIFLLHFHSAFVYFRIIWYLFLLFFYILQLTTTLYQYYHVNRAHSLSFSSSRCPSQPRFNSPSRFRAYPSFLRPYFHLAARRSHLRPLPMLEFIRNPTAAPRHITPQLPPSSVLF